MALEASGDPIAEHHTLGGRRVSALDPSRRGLPVLPFSVMAEMVAQVGALLVPPGSVLVGLRDVRANRWVRYEEAPITLELIGRLVDGVPGAVRVELVNRGAEGTTAPGTPLVFEGVAVFADARDEAPPAAPFAVADPSPSRFTAESLYEEQWLFHGPVLQALAEVGRVGPDGIEGAIRVLSRGSLFRDGAEPRLWSDPIVIDTFTHLLGCWGLDFLADEGDVIFPLGMASLEVFGDDPPEGTLVGCRIVVRSVERHRVRVDAEIVRPDGRVWMRIGGWEDWRFHWPARYRDVFRMPDRVLVGESIDLVCMSERNAVAVWLEPPADMGRPVWRDVLEQTQLGPRERASFLAANATGPESRRARRLWGRIAAKEAARRLKLALGDVTPAYPADLEIEPDANGRPRLRSLAEPNRDDAPAVSIAHTEGVAIALAAADPGARVGIDVELIVDRSADFEALALSPSERGLLADRSGADRAEWVARLWCAKEAASKATGLGLVRGPASVEVARLDAETGAALVRLGPELAAACPEIAGAPLIVRTARRGGYAWAWTLAEPGGLDR